MKTCLVGYTPDHSGQEALHLGRVLTATPGTQLIVCTVTPEAWSLPTLGPVDQEYSNFLSQYAQTTLDKARAQLADLPNVQYEAHHASSPTIGLSEAAELHGADLIVIGSSHQGSAGRLTLGSLGSELLHTAALPVAMAPRDYRPPRGTRLPRLTCAYSGQEAASGTVLAALGLANALGVPLRLVSFAVRDRQMFPSLVGYHSEDVIINAWREQAQASFDRLHDQLSGNNPPVETLISEGNTWHDALDNLDWEPGEVLALGSSRMGVLARVFLGSNASKIMRASPVPVIVLPKAS